jgi:hypothetical protein
VFDIGKATRYLYGVMASGCSYTWGPRFGGAHLSTVF